MQNEEKALIVQKKPGLFKRIGMFFSNLNKSRKEEKK